MTGRQTDTEILLLYLAEAYSNVNVFHVLVLLNFIARSNVKPYDFLPSRTVALNEFIIFICIYIYMYIIYMCI